MNFFFVLLPVVATALTAVASPNDTPPNLDAFLKTDSLTITFYTHPDCKDGLDTAYKNNAVLTCKDDFGDSKAAESTCVSGKFASYKISDQRNSVEKLASISVITGQSQCSAFGTKAAQTYKPSIMDYVKGGCHNFGTAEVKQCNLPLGIHDDTVHTYKCTPSSVSLQKRKLGSKGKGSNWTLDGARFNKEDASAGLEKRSEQTGKTPVEQAKHGKIKTDSKGKGEAWIIEGAACAKGVHCKQPPNKPRVDDEAKGPRMEKRWKSDKGKGNAWLIEGVVVPAEKSLYCDAQ